MTLNCNGQLVDLTTPKVMGILNITPDSFYSGSRIPTLEQALIRTAKMLEDGATFIDIGGYSSRPGADDITEAEEISRVIPIIKALKTEFPNLLLSIDTFRGPVARAAIESGATLVNDISAGLMDTDMLELIAEKRVPYIMMHMRGTPTTMSRLTEYEEIVQEILYYFSERLERARALGITDIIADPGFGFAKTREQNFELLGKLDAFKILEVPVLAGISRKSMIWKTLNITADEALNGTTALNMVALQKGADILRVHDVAEAVQCIKLKEALDQSGTAQSL
jgi:dihydropteroate synthase